MSERFTTIRFLSTEGGNGGKKDPKDVDNLPLELLDDPSSSEGPFDVKYQLPKIEPTPLLSVKEPKDDPFGLNFDDGDDGLGPTLPPSYKRDKTTGAFLGEIEHELTEADKRALQILANDRDRDRKAVDSLEQHWEKKGVDESGSPAELNELGQRVRESELGLNVLGRSVRAQASKEELADGSEVGRDKKGFSKPLTKQEFRNFSEFMERKHGIVIAEEDIPVQENKSASTRRMEAVSEEDPDHRALALKWLTARAQRQLDGATDENPFSDLMPGDLSHSRLVNRRRAKRIPMALHHQNNVELLQHFLAPTGIIRNRAQTRLGAWDQRKVAKFVKRARNMGLIPYAGQYKVENHGWLHAPDIHEVKDWEKEMVERGLVIKKKTESATKESDDITGEDTSGATNNASV